MSASITARVTRALLPPLLTVGAVAVPGALGTAPAAAGTVPSATHGRPGPPVLPVVVTTSGFTVPGPNPRPAGLVTLDVSTPDFAGHWFGPLKPKASLGWDGMMDVMGRSNSTDPAVALPALGELYRDVEFYGGAAVFPESPVRVTTYLDPGTYYFADSSVTTEDPTDPDYPHQEITVGRWARPAAPPRADARVDIREVDGVPRFDVPARIPADGTYRITNHGRIQPYEALFARVIPGTTEAEVAATLESWRTGTPAKNVFETWPQGMLPLSPGRSATLQFDVTPGTYALLSFTRNPQTGVGRSMEGMFTLVDLV